MSDNCRVEFLIYTLPHPGGCLVLVMAAVFTCCNWTKMVFDYPKAGYFWCCMSSLVLSILGCGCLLTFPIKTSF